MSAIIPDANGGFPYAKESNKSLLRRLTQFASTQRKVFPEQKLGLAAQNKVQWQWTHSTGWRDYDAIANEKIERAYQRGEHKVRIKSGKSGKVPMVVFFLENPMKQFDPTSQGVRDVQRVGPKEKIGNKVRLRANRIKRGLESGHNGREQLENFKQRKQDLYQSSKREHHVSDYYHERGYCAFIAKSDAFFIITMLAVAFNGVWIAYDVDYNEAVTISDAKPMFQAVENTLCGIFTVELLIRFGAFKVKSNAFMDAWFRLDFLLVSLMVVECWVLPLFLVVIGGEGGGTSLGDLSILRIARLMRIARMSRLLRACPEVVTLLKGIAKAIRSVFLAMLLLCIALYVSAIVCRTMVRDYATLEHMYFSSMSHALGTLLLCCTFLDNVSILLNDTWSEAGFFLTAFLLCVIFGSSFTILNMLIGILCEVVSNVSRDEKEEADVTYLKQNLMQLMEAYDAEDDQKLGKEEFRLLMHNPDVVNVLKNFGTNPEGLLALIDLHFEDHAETTKKRNTIVGLSTQEFEDSDDEEEEGPPQIEFEDFIRLVSRMRGSNPARVTDIVELREYTRQCVKRLEAKINRQDTTRASRRCSTTPPFRGHSHLWGEQASAGVSSDDGPPPSPRQRTATISVDGDLSPKEPRMQMVVVEASFRGQNSLHRHSSRLTVGEFLEQLAPEHGQLKAMDFDGKRLGMELRLGDIVGNGGVLLQGELAVQLKLLSLARPQELGQTCNRALQIEEKMQHVPECQSGLVLDCGRAQAEELQHLMLPNTETSVHPNCPTPPQEEKLSLRPPPPGAPPQFPKSEEPSSITTTLFTGTETKEAIAAEWPGRQGSTSN